MAFLNLKIIIINESSEQRLKDLLIKRLDFLNYWLKKLMSNIKLPTR